MPETPQKEPHHSAPASVPHCLFCGAIGAWWDCHCGPAQKIREGKLPRPRTVMRNGVPVIECCDELRAAARLAGVIRVTDSPANKAVHAAAPVNTAEGSVNTRADPVNSEHPAVNSDDARKAYRREWMRRKRSEERDGDA